MIDLTELKVGDTVVLRCGGRIVVDKVYEYRKNQTLINDMVWDNNGKRGNNGQFDIIAIEPATEPRTSVEYAAFYWKEGIYIGSSLEECKEYWANAENYFKITIPEGKPATIEEIK
jgi:hypothetical protein